MGNYLHIINTTVVYLFIILALRVLGKTELAQLSITDQYKHHSVRRLKKEKMLD